MKLQSDISGPLWNAVSNSYKAKNYSNSISDALKYLSGRIRIKSGEDGDGVALINAALAVEPPKIKINKYQTENDRSIQKGYYHLLRGLYQGIRNPRAHIQLQDTKEDADAIIHFINYLVLILEAAEGQFSAHGFVGNIISDDSFPEGNYAKHLADEIPDDKRLVTLFELYENADSDSEKIGPVCREIYQYLDDAELSEFISAASTNLRKFVIEFENHPHGVGLEFDNPIWVHFLVLSPKVWPRINKVAKWRVESAIIDILDRTYASLETESFIITEDLEISAELATAALANEYLEYFEEDNREKVQEAFLNILSNLDRDEVLYFFHFFLPYLPALVGEDKERKEDFIKLIANAVNNNKPSYMLSTLPSTLRNLPNGWAEPLSELLPFLIKRSDEVARNPGYGKSGQ